jgi:hypothetical protein
MAKAGRCPPDTIATEGQGEGVQRCPIGLSPHLSSLPCAEEGAICLLMDALIGVLTLEL